MEFSHVPLLNGTNWSQWRQNIKVYLLHVDSWQFIYSKESKNETEIKGAEKGEKAEIDPKSFSETKTPVLTFREQSELRLKETRAYTIIYQSIADEYKPLIAECASGKEAWDTLNKYFEPTTRARIMQLLDDFFGISYRNGEQIGLFLCRVRDAANKLREAGHAVNDLYIGFQMIRSLPSDFRPIVQQIYRWPDPEFNPVRIEQEIILESNRLSIMQKGAVSKIDISSKVFMSQESCVTRTGGGVTKKKMTDHSPKKEGKFKRGVCWYCGKQGHFKDKCFKFKCKNKTDHNNLAEITETAYNTVSPGNSLNDWVMDSGATSHFCRDKDMFSDFKPVDNLKMSLAVAGESSNVCGVGSVKFYVKSKGKAKLVTLGKVLYNPNIRRNLLSLTQLESEGGKFKGENGKVNVYDKSGKLLFYAKRRKDINLYFFRPYKYRLNAANNATAQKMNDEELWHKRFGHVNYDYLKKTCQLNSVRGLPTLNFKRVNCELCRVTKSSRTSFKQIDKIRSKRPLELLHLDVGMMPSKSIGGSQYYLTIIDDFSRWVTTYPIAKKSDCFNAFVNYMKRAERSLGLKVVAIRTDNGGEFCGFQFTNFLKKCGIKHELTNAYSPQMNGVVERFNRTLVAGIRALLKEGNVPEQFWGEAAVCFTYIWNRTCSRNDVTPFEKYFKFKPSVKHFRIFGCRVYLKT